MRLMAQDFSRPKANPLPVGDGTSAGVLEFTRSETKCDIPPGLTLLEAAEKNGIVISYSCREAQCGTCVTRLVACAVRMDAEVGLTDELRKEDMCCPVSVERARRRQARGVAKSFHSNRRRTHEVSELLPYFPNEVDR
jgi:ferredoxin